MPLEQAREVMEHALMHFPRFWARASQGGCSAWGWSDAGNAEAEARARENAQRAAERLSRENLREDVAARRYAYGVRPLREPVLAEIKDDRGEITALVTRNSYGCVVLNAARVMFIDVDFAAPITEKRGGGWLKSLFGKTGDNPAQSAHDEAIARAEGWARRSPGWGWRVYRTRAGLRLLATHALFDAASAAGEPLFRELGADPLYRELCKAQRCFRARLTPKPWRCGIENPPARWPFNDDDAEGRFNQWERRYQRACEGKAVCELLRVLGNPAVNPGVQEVLALHDRLTGAESRLPLA